MITLRPARPTDAGKIGAILSGFIDQTDWMPRLHSRAEEVAFCGAMIDRGWVTVAEDAGGVQGFLARDGAEVNCLYVADAAQGQGVGRALLDHAKAGAERLKLWTFQANAGARRFYAREGFAELRLTDGAGNDEQMPDVFLAWEKGAPCAATHS